MPESFEMMGGIPSNDPYSPRLTVEEPGDPQSRTAYEAPGVELRAVRHLKPLYLSGRNGRVAHYDDQQEPDLIQLMKEGFPEAKVAPPMLHRDYIDLRLALGLNKSAQKAQRQGVDGKDPAEDQKPSDVDPPSAAPPSDAAASVGKRPSQAPPAKKSVSDAPRKSEAGTGEATSAPEATSTDKPETGTTGPQRHTVYPPNKVTVSPFSTNGYIILETDQPEDAVATIPGADQPLGPLHIPESAGPQTAPPGFFPGFTRLGKKYFKRLKAVGIGRDIEPLLESDPSIPHTGVMFPEHFATAPPFSTPGYISTGTKQPVGVLKNEPTSLNHRSAIVGNQEVDIPMWVSPLYSSYGIGGPFGPHGPYFRPPAERPCREETIQDSRTMSMPPMSSVYVEKPPWTLMRLLKMAKCILTGKSCTRTVGVQAAMAYLEPLAFLPREQSDKEGETKAEGESGEQTNKPEEKSEKGEKKKPESKEKKKPGSKEKK